MTNELLSADQRLSIWGDRLKYHDWYYDYSDDHRVWSRGDQDNRWIQSEKAYLNSMGLEQQTQALWEQYCPWSETNRQKSA
jgi:hypothetical protein